eukprot:111414-Rhodomonas_salina.3
MEEKQPKREATQPKKGVTQPKMEVTQPKMEADLRRSTLRKSHRRSMLVLQTEVSTHSTKTLGSTLPQASTTRVVEP